MATKSSRTIPDQIQETTLRAKVSRVAQVRHEPWLKLLVGELYRNYMGISQKIAGSKIDPNIL